MKEFWRFVRYPTRAEFRRQYAVLGVLAVLNALIIAPVLPIKALLAYLLICVCLWAGCVWADATVGRWPWGEK